MESTINSLIDTCKTLRILRMISLEKYVTQYVLYHLKRNQTLKELYVEGKGILRRNIRRGWHHWRASWVQQNSAKAVYTIDAAISFSTESRPCFNIRVLGEILSYWNWSLVDLLLNYEPDEIDVAKLKHDIVQNTSLQRFSSSIISYLRTRNTRSSRRNTTWQMANAEK